MYPETPINLLCLFKQTYVNIRTYVIYEIHVSKKLNCKILAFIDLKVSFKKLSNTILFQCIHYLYFKVLEENIENYQKLINILFSSICHTGDEENTEHFKA